MALVPGPLLEETAARFALMGDPTRLYLLSLLCERGETSVGDLAEAASISVANASQHLRRLMLGGILGRRKVGNQVFYRVVEQTIQQLCEIVCASVDQRARLLESSSID
jgi:DNA-binding transcriptional ArsR family regulator